VRLTLHSPAQHQQRRKRILGHSLLVKLTLHSPAQHQQRRKKWGKKFIVLPNSVYGEWENAIYNYERNLTPGQKENKRREKLKGY
jgi:predicted secreted acid phosphatase